MRANKFLPAQMPSAVAHAATGGGIAVRCHSAMQHLANIITTVTISDLPVHGSYSSGFAAHRWPDRA